MDTKKILKSFIRIAKGIREYNLTKFPITDFGVQCPFRFSENQALDRNYFTVSVNDFQKILQEDWTSQLKFSSENFDCDDFSIMLKGHLSSEYGINLYGVAIGAIEINGNWTAHSFGVFMDSSKEWYIVEPQTNGISKASLGKIEDKRYSVNYIIL